MPKTYGWSATAYEEVADAGTLVVPAPGLTDAVDPATAEVAVDNAVYDSTQAPTAFDVANETITVTNSTGAPWAPDVSVYVSASGVPIAGSAEDLTDQLADMQSQITAQAGQIADHETRIAALEAAGTPAADPEPEPEPDPELEPDPEEEPV